MYLDCNVNVGKRGLHEGVSPLSTYQIFQLVLFDENYFMKFVY